MSLELIDWSDDLAFQVFRDLDLYDRIEAALWRGDDAHPLALWCDWRAWAGWRAVTRIAVWRRGATLLPIAVLGWQPTGAKGVVQAALLARDHKLHRRALIPLARRLRKHLPDVAAEAGLTRIECRSWTGHPTAGRLLTAIGFRLEVAELAGMPGTFAQYVLTLDPGGEPPCA